MTDPKAHQAACLMPSEASSPGSRLVTTTEPPFGGVVPLRICPDSKIYLPEPQTKLGQPQPLPPPFSSCPLSMGKQRLWTRDRSGMQKGTKDFGASRKTKEGQEGTAVCKGKPETGTKLRP